MSSDEPFHVHRGQALLFYVAKNIGLLGSEFNTSQEMVIGSFDRHPLLSMFPQAISFAIFGGLKSVPYIITEGLGSVTNHFILDNLAVRMPSIIFTILTFFVIFKLSSLYYDKKTSFLASASFLFFPTYFMLSSTAMLTSGVVFFAVLISYFTVKFAKPKTRNT